MNVVKIILVGLFLFGANAISAQDVKKTAKKANTEEQVVFVVSIDCHNCEQKIKKNIAYEKGVKDLNTNLEKQLVTIKYQTDKTDKAKLKKSIEKLGFTCTEVTESKQGQ